MLSIYLFAQVFEQPCFIQHLYAGSYHIFLVMVARQEEPGALAGSTEIRVYIQSL